ncbi:MAG: photosystem II complex extrinsic protein PsbU [Moorea sp. SIOASIH]|uniref:photosystem II complex extrinsic protein PsbU n=1 Tax=Moorena sp. SIOASIH TaxID=2607817 RepID=UPI0013B81BE0|nr:photosystem II complex extrinsic protein PsbU [Moorena sp. SIOASIH]NEO39947.1 photosystem II complex extrinsic protein PsbU [Moorena sp. SIOASIH]
MRKLVHLAVLCLLVLSLGCLGLPQSAIASPMSSADTFSLNNLTLPSSTALIARSSNSNEAQSPQSNAADAKLSTEFGKKTDLNNTPLRKFRKYRGFYPTLASKIVNYAKDEGDYKSVEDVLKIPGLSERQKKLLQDQIDQKSFTVTPRSEVHNAGDDRINPGVY